MATEQPFDFYRRNKKKLQAPFNWLKEKMQADGRELVVSTWRDSRLPEFLWTALILKQLPAVQAFPILRELAKGWPVQAGRLEDRLSVISHSRLAHLESLNHDIVGFILNKLPTKDILRPLLLLPNLPAAEAWKQRLDASPLEGDGQTLGETVQAASDFHSDIATDICWFLNLVAASTGAVEEPPQFKTDSKRNQYPESREETGGFFRTMELQERMHHEPKWANLFWADVFMMFPSQAAERDFGDPRPLLPMLDGLLPSYQGLLERHFWETRENSDDRLHEMVFGFLFQSANLAYEAVQTRVHNRALGLFTLRSIAEATINLAYLIKKNDADLWAKYRAYGYGKARLLLEKLKADPLIPIDAEWVRAFAGEEKGKHLTDIDLGDWCGENLRTRAIASETKELYDRYYDYTSGISHAEWLGVNLVGLSWDINPFHRLQHVPLKRPRVLRSILPDLFWLLNKQADLMEVLYPGFQMRLPVRAAAED